MFWRLTFGVVLAVASLPLSVQAQTFGEITGLVNDASGAIMAATTVTVTNQLTGATRTVTSNEAGIYSVPSLLPGLYALKAERPGSARCREPISSCRCNKRPASTSLCRSDR